MSLFDGVTFQWGGKTVSLPPDRLLGALARLEEHVSLGELAAMGHRVRYGRLARGVAAVLRYAGHHADPEAVYAAILTDPGARGAAGAAVAALLAVASPPVGRKRGGDGPAKAGPGLVASMLQAVVGNGWASPSEFRAMHPREVWWLIEAKRPPKMVTKNMTEDEAEEIYAEAYGTEEEAA